MKAAGAVMKLIAGERDSRTGGLSRDDIREWLVESEAWKLDFLWQEADRVRRERVGDEVHLRGLVELSNYCRRDCHYCGIRASRHIERYRMTEAEVMEAAQTGVRLGNGTVVLQAGEDPGLTADFIARLVRRIKAETPLAVTLSLGERSVGELAAWRQAGADRYLLKHETSDRVLFRRIHPDCGSEVSDRIALLKRARELGYEIGTGVMVGIPGQTCESLADDIMLFRELDADMIGCGPFVPHPDTPLGSADEVEGQVPNTDLMTTKVVALTRIVCPDANIPSTTALATVNREKGRELGLVRGANVWMPNLTPLKYRVMYEIYPGKAAVLDTAEQYHANLMATLAELGRVPGRGQGARSGARRPAGPGRS